MNLFVNNNLLRTTIDFSAGHTSPQVLFLHGAGEGNRHRTEYLALAMADRGWTSVRFDFSGHGDSSGALLGSTLTGRLSEAAAAGLLLDRSKPTVVIGNSMGGYLAARLTRLIPIAHLVLVCPAAYAPEVETVPFGPDFSAILRRPDSYIGSLSFNDVADFKGRVTVIAGSADNVIPAKVIDLYLRAARGRSNLPHEAVVLDGAVHLLHSWLESHQDDRERLLGLIDRNPYPLHFG